MATPDQYVAAALSKCNSGVHSGYWVHEIIHLVWMNINDIAPIELCMTFFNKLLKSHMDELPGANKKGK